MYYLILILALQQGEAAFIDQHITLAGKGVLSTYASIFTDVLFFMSVGVSVFLIKVRFKGIPWAGSTLINIYLLYIIVLWVASFFNYLDAGEVFLTGRTFMYIPLSYYLWMAIYQKITREQYEQFLRMMFYVTPVSTLIYILNSAKIIHVYDETLIYEEVNFGADSFLRDFKTIPLWLIPVLVLAIQAMITPALKISRKIIILNIIILPIGVLFTFTRSTLFSVLMQTVFLFMLFGRKLSFKLVANVVIFATFIGLSLLVIQKVFPSQSSYFAERLTSAKTEGKSEQNVNVRLEYLTETIRITNDHSPFVGAGMNRKYYNRMQAVGAWIADSTIPFFLMHTGWIGVLLLFGIVLYFAAASLFTFLKTKDWLTGYLCAYFTGLFIYCLLNGGEVLNGTVWTFMNFALYSVIRANRWKAAPAIT